MKNQSFRVIYAGTPEFATPALRSLVDANYDVVAVYTQPDRRSGRGRKLVHGPVKSLALELGLPVVQPDSFKDENVVRELGCFNADLMVVAAYGLLLPQSVLDLPKHGCINIHASLLPRWRGAAPIQRAIEAGDDTTGVTIMQMQAGLDTGDMLHKKSLQITPAMTAASLHDQLANDGAAALIEVLGQLQRGMLCAEPQNEELVTYAHKLQKAEAVLDWETSAVELHRKVCAFNAWPVAQTLLRGEVLRIWESLVVDEQSATNVPGTVVAVDAGIDVATTTGTLRLLRVQAPGKKPVAASEFVNSSKLQVGTHLGR